MNTLWNYILSVNPKTKDIFLKNHGFDIKKQSTYKQIIEEFNNFDFESLETDIQGEAYEKVIKDIMTGKIFGQFFTPSEIKTMLINKINPDVNEDGTIETIFDPAMGTAGLLINALRHIIKKSKDKNIDLDWKFISEVGINGREIVADTFQLAKSNLLISTGYAFNENIELN